MERTIDECFFQIQNGANIKQGDVDGGYPITRIETTANDKFNRDRMGYAGITDLSKYESYVLEDGDLLMSHINSVQYLGRTVLYEKKENETIIHGMNLLRLKARGDIINPAYARYCFYGHPFRSQVANITKKSVNQASFAVKDLKQIKIDVPEMNQQNQIVEILNKTSELIEKRQQELDAFDELIKARFVEMFGNPFDTQKPVDWPVKTIKDLAESISDGSNVDKTLYKEQGDILFLRIQNVWCNEFRLDDSVYISEAENEVYLDTSLKHGDLLITKIGRYYTADSSLGRVSVYLGEDNKANYSNNIMRVRFREGINSEFVNVLMNLDDYNKYIRRTSVGGTDKRALSKGLIASYPIIVPSITRQNEFVNFVHQVDKSKVIEIAA